jgi:hypothetical protein
MALVKQDDGEDMIIKPEAVTPAIDTSAWPLLLRNWDQCECFSLSYQSQCTNEAQYSSAPATSHLSPPAAHHCVGTSNHISRLASSTSTNPRIPRRTKW